MSDRTISIGTSPAFIVLKMKGKSGESELVRRPVEQIESDIVSGIEALRLHGLLSAARTCLIAVPRGSLSGSFMHIYEVVRRCGWSILPLGGSRDGQDISQLCKDYAVNTVFIAADAVDTVFSSDMAGRFDGVDIVLSTGLLSATTALRMHQNFPHITFYPFRVPPVGEVTTPEL